MRLKPEQQYNIFYYYLIYTALLRVLLAKRAREAYLLSDTEDGPAGFLPNPRGASQASLGFEKIKTTDVSTGKYAITTYRQDKPYHGIPAVTRNYLANGELISEQTASPLEQYLCDETGCTLDAASNAHPALPRQIRQSGESVTKQFINGIEALVTRQSVVSYDNYGNPIETQKVRQLGGETFTEHDYATYLNSLGDATHARAIGLRLSIKKCVEDCSLFNTTEDEEYYYDNLPMGQIGLTHNLTSMKTRVGAIMLTKNMTYYPNGNLHTEFGESGAVKTYTYDADYLQFIKETRLIVAGQSDQVTTQEADPRFGTVIESTDIYGNKTETELDAQGRTKEQRVRNGSTLLRRISFEHHLTGNPNPADHYTMKCTHRKASALDNDFTLKDCAYTYFDALNRKYLAITPGFNGNVPAFVAVHTKYDDKGRVTHESAPYFKADTTSALGTPAHYSQTIYDAAGRPWQNVSTDNKTTQTDIIYAGGNFVTTRTTAEDGTVREFTTDVRGLTRSVTEAKGTAVESNLTYTYYTNGLLWQVNAPQGLTVTDYYADTKQQKSITDPNVGTTHYTYENNITSPAYGKLLVETRPAPNGAGTVTVTHEYNDAYGRLTRQIFSTGDETLFIYDETDVGYGKNRLTTREYKTQGYSYKERHSYDLLGQEIATTTDIAKPGETLCTNPGDIPCHSLISTFYDEQGRKTKVVYPDLKETVISYYGGSPHVAAVAHNGTTYANYDGYDARGKITGIHYGNGARTEFQYAAATGLLENLKTLDAQNRAIQDLDYTFNDRRSIEDLTDNVLPNASYHYEYDALNRIKRATRTDGKVFNYAFDEKGNLTLKENRTQVYYANSTKLQYSDLATSGGTIRTDFTWSASGNLLQRTSGGEAINYTWSAQNFLIESTRLGGTLNGTKTTNVYAGEANRFLRSYEQPGKQKVKTWDLGGVEVRETWSGLIRVNIQITKYIYGIDGGRIASLTGNPGDLSVYASSGHQ